MEKDKISIWTPQQQQALAALKLTHWQRYVPNTANDIVASSASSGERYCYKAGQWLLVSDEPLSVEMPIWLKDLVRVCTGNPERPAELSSSALAKWQKELVLRVPNQYPAGAQKKQLWEKLAQLSS